MKGKDGKVMASITMLQARELLKAAEAYRGSGVERDAVETWCLDVAIEKLSVALGDRPAVTSYPAK